MTQTYDPLAQKNPPQAQSIRQLKQAFPNLLHFVIEVDHSSVRFGYISHQTIASMRRRSRNLLKFTILQTAIEQERLAHLGFDKESKTGSNLDAEESEKTQVVDNIGAPDRNRTCNLLIRSQVLYPIELRAHVLFINDFGESVTGAEWSSVN